MNKTKREHLEAKGWRAGTVAEFLGLAPEESALIEIRLVLGQYLKQRRESSMTQAELADKIGTSKPQIAKAESGDTSVSLDLLVRAALATGATPVEIGKAIAGAGLLAEMR